MSEELIIGNETPEVEEVATEEAADALTGETENDEAEQAEKAEHIEDADKADEPKGKVITPEVQEKINKTINKKHFEMMQAKREKEEAEKQLQQLREQLEQLRAPAGEIPPMPDPLDDNYEEKVRQRDAIIAQQAQYAAQKAALEAAEQQKQLEQALAKQKELEAKVKAYAQRAEKMGIDKDRLKEAGDTVANYGIDESLAMAILDDDQGAAITVFLASNPLELENLQTMTPVQQALYIERQIRPKLSQLKPKASKAPKPPKDVDGGGMDVEASKYPHLKGATFE